MKSKTPSSISNTFDAALSRAVARPLAGAQPRLVFCPPGPGATPETIAHARRWYAHARARTALFLPDHAGSLEWGAIPGATTFYSPRAPMAAATALLSASQVVSFRVEPACYAAAQGIPTLLVSDDAQVLARAREQGIACASAAAPAAFPSPTARAPRPAPAVGAPLHVASISDTAYLPFLIGFIENALAVQPGPVVFHVLCLDAATGPRLKALFPSQAIEIYTLESLWTASELPEILTRSVGFRAFSSKPRLLARALKSAQGPVVYADSDVYFFSPPGDIVEALEGETVLLFPHWNDEFHAARTDGVFNAGMLAVAPGAEAFLQWWGDCCGKACRFDRASGFVGDQSYLDFAPAYFPKVKVYRQGDQNVARWNLETLGVSWGSDGPVVWDGRPVKTFHAAFVDSAGFFEVKFAWDQLATFFSCGEQESPPLRRNTLLQQRAHWLALSRALTLHERFSSTPSPEALAFWLTPVGLKLLETLAWGNRFRNGVSGGLADPMRAFWIEGQRERLIGLVRAEAADQAARFLGARR